MSVESISPACLREFCNVSGHFFWPHFKNTNNETMSVTKYWVLCSKGCLVQMREEKGALMDAVVPHPDLFRGQCTRPPSCRCSEDALLTAGPFFRETLVGATLSGEVLSPPSFLGWQHLAQSLILTWTKSELQSSPWDEARASVQLRLKPLKCVWWGGCVRGTAVLFVSAQEEFSEGLKWWIRSDLFG